MGEELKVLIFSIADEYFAADIMEVERILEYEVSTKIPNAPDFVEGVINYQGEILPVISLIKKFNLKCDKDRKHGDSKIVVAKRNDEKVGIIVDEVSEVKDIDVKNVEGTPEVAVKISKRYIKGLIKIDKKIVIFLNLSNILTDEERKIIE